MKLDLTAEQVKEATNTEIVESIHFATAGKMRYDLINSVAHELRDKIFPLTFNKQFESFRLSPQAIDISLRYEIKKCFTQPTPIKIAPERMPDQSR